MFDGGQELWSLQMASSWAYLPLILLSTVFENFTGSTRLGFGFLFCLFVCPPPSGELLSSEAVKILCWSPLEMSCYLGTSQIMVCDHSLVILVLPLEHQGSTLWEHIPEEHLSEQILEAKNVEILCCLTLKSVTPFALLICFSQWVKGGLILTCLCKQKRISLISLLSAPLVWLKANSLILQGDAQKAAL